MNDIFANYEKAELWYHPLADRIFVFHRATFLMLPCLEREDGVKMICSHPTDVNSGIKTVDEAFEFIGDL